MADESGSKTERAVGTYEPSSRTRTAGDGRRAGGTYVVVRSADGFVETVGQAEGARWLDGAVWVLVGDRWLRMGSEPFMRSGDDVTVTYLVDSTEPVNA